MITGVIIIIDVHTLSICVYSFKHRATPVFFTDDPGDLVLDEGEKQSECLSTDSGNLQGTENECCGLQQMVS